MAEDKQPARACPACGSGDYRFRSRRQIEAADGQEAMLETKYRCQPCGHEWKEKVPGVLSEAAGGWDGVAGAANLGRPLPQGRRVGEAGVSVGLRNLLGRAGCADAVTAWMSTAEVPAGLRALFIPHVRDVLRRVDAAGEEAGLWPVKLAALVHESPQEALPALLEAAGFADVAGQVAAVVAGFGAVWKTQGEAGLAAFTREHAPCLRQLLLFELAHEGRATAAMHRAAALGGFAGEMARWQAGLLTLKDGGGPHDGA